MACSSMSAVHGSRLESPGCSSQAAPSWGSSTTRSPALPLIQGPWRTSPQLFHFPEIFWPGTPLNLATGPAGGRGRCFALAGGGWELTGGGGGGRQRVAAHGRPLAER